MQFSTKTVAPEKLKTACAVVPVVNGQALFGSAQTIDAACGAITLVSAAGTTSWQSFTVTNSVVAATDTVIVNQKIPCVEMNCILFNP